MSTTISCICKNENCAKETKEEDKWRAVIDFDGNRKTLCEYVGGKNGNRHVKCKCCGFEFVDETVVRQRKKMGYPYYCASTDQTFMSYSDQRQFEKKNGLEPL